MKLPAILMVGGKNTRFKFDEINQPIEEKLMLPLGKNNIVDFSIKAALNSKYISYLIIGCSPNASITHEYIKQKYGSLKIIETDGKGYVQDIQSIIKILNLKEVLTMVGDVPFITSKILNTIIKSYFKLRPEALSAVIPSICYQKYGLNIPHNYSFLEKGEKLIYTGFNVIDGRFISQKQMSQDNIIIDDIRIMININTVEDYYQAKAYYANLKKQ
jgi:GTP:adenosylcobinamide-phosphate guanylyltransferase